MDVGTPPPYAEIQHSYFTLIKNTSEIFKEKTFYIIILNYSLHNEYQQSFITGI